MLTPLAVLGLQTFTIHCNSDTNSDPIMSLFVADFNSCMDSCSAYNKYIPQDFNQNATKSNNGSCSAVSFIPLWTQKANASDGGAPGNCYLKPAHTKLQAANIGTECHVGLLASG